MNDDDGSGWVAFSTYYDDGSTYWEDNIYVQSNDGVVWETIDAGFDTYNYYLSSDGGPPQIRNEESLPERILGRLFPTAYAASPCDCKVGAWGDSR
jgi:hypothetical protein